MKKIALLLILLVMAVSKQFPTGAPKSIFGGRNYNSFSLCCAEGFVQDAEEGFTCVSCDSVGLIQCAVCTLLYEQKQDQSYWHLYRCLASKNINNLITVGSSSQCTNPQGLADNTYVLNNFSNFDSCVPCNSIIKNVQSCKITYNCELNLPSNTGNDCVPSIKVDKCADGFFYSDDINTCQTCSQHIYGCTSCSNGTTCLLCDASLNLTKYEFENHCSCTTDTSCTICHSHQILNAVTQTCECIPGYVKNLQDRCIEFLPCNNHEIWNPINSSCQCENGFIKNAHGECQVIVCEQNMELSTRGVCICKNSYFLVGSQCIQSDGYFAKTPAYSIDTTANNMTYSTTTGYKCICPTGFKLINSQCIPCSLLGIECSCQPTKVKFNGVCQPCSSHNQRDCLECEIVDFWGEPFGSCKRCLPGYQLVTSENIQRCQPCIRNCSECFDNYEQPRNSTQICTTCFTKNVMVDHRGTCATCNFIPNCVYCGYNIEKAKPTNCLRCETPYVLGKDGLTCVCPSPLLMDRRCIPCHFGCLSCLAQTCLKCKPSMIKDNVTGSCICASQTLIADLGCDNCKEPLSERNIQGCSACNSSKSCSNCVSGFISVQGNCQRCSRYLLGCKTCNSQTACTSCDEQNHFKLPLLSHTCSCITGFVLIGGRCSNCSLFWKGCQECTNLTSCSKCDTANNFQLHNGSCQCKQHSYLAHNSTCVNCNQITLACTNCNSIGQCTQCMVNFDLLPNHTCACKSGYTLINNQCSKCSQLFQGCSLCNTTRCTKCANEYFVFDVNTSRCVEKQCFSCLNCVEGKCKQCKNDLYTFLTPQGICICDTSIQYYANYTTNVCQQCSDYPTCLRCINSTRCTKCSNQTYLSNQGQCDCQQQNQFYNTATLKCEQCVLFCKICEKREKKCVKCQPGFAYHEEFNVCYQIYLPEPQTPEPQTPQPQTPEPQTPEPQTPEPQTPEPQTPEPQTPEPQTPEPQTPEPPSEQP